METLPGSRRGRAGRALCSAALSLAALFSGCAATVDVDYPPAPERPLRVDANGFVALAAEGFSDPQDLVARVDRLLRAGKRGSAERLVRLFPDLSSMALGASAPPASNPPLLLIASMHDRQCGGGTPGSGWEALLRDQAADPDRYEDYYAARVRLLAALAERRYGDAADEGTIPAPDDSPARTVLRVEAFRLAGTSLLLDDRFEEAAETLERGFDTARTTRPFEGARIGLLLAEAEHRRGAGDAAAAAWRQTVSLAAALAEEPRAAFDPDFWERALNLRPPGAIWPPQVREWIAARAKRVLGFRKSAESETAADALLWGLMGDARLRRSEPGRAVVCFSRGKSLASGAAAAGIGPRLGLGQARALAAAGEPAAAHSLLAPVAAETDLEAALGAQAVLGALEIKLGNRTLGIEILEKAVAAQAPPDWFERSEAEANLGLAYLMGGKPAEGLRLLHGAEDRWEMEKNYPELIQALRNELRYLQQNGKEKEAEALQLRLRAYEAR